MTMKKLVVFVTGLIASYAAGTFAEQRINSSNANEYEKQEVKMIICPVIGFGIGLIMRMILKRIK